MNRRRLFSVLLWVLPTLLSLPAQANCYRLVRQPAVNHMALVIDRSGSMNGRPLADAKAGAHAFIDGMNPNDRAAIIIFGSNVELAHGMTDDRSSLHDAVDRITVKGLTALNDAIARASLMLAGQQGGRIIVYLTDGKDTGSRYSTSDLHKMNLSEGVFIYGIGLGDVDRDALGRLSQATHGVFEHTQSS